MVVAGQGLKGEVRINSSSDFPQRFLKPGPRWLQINAQSSPQAVELLRGYHVPGKNIYVVKFLGIDTRQQADSLKGYKFLVNSGDRPFLESEEYHVQDLINLTVFNQLNGENIGVITNIFTAGHELLEVTLTEELPANNLEVEEKKSKKLTVLIPFVKEIVPIVDLEKGKIEINPPKGLLEIHN